MKRFIAVLSGILVLPAFAEVAPVYYDEVVEYTDDMPVDEVVVEKDATTMLPKTVVQRGTVNRSASASRAGTATRATATRSSANKARTATSRAARTSSVVNRPATTSSRTSVRARGTQSTKPVTARVAVTGKSVIAGTYTNEDTTKIKVLEGSSEAAYNPSAARVSVATGGGRAKTVRLSTAAITPTTTSVVTATDVASTTNNMSAIAELTEYCQAQYAACMDNFCNVLDDNQGRCSCSKNVKNYEKTETALAAATEQFQEVIQKIRYIGLTGPQIEALFAETEAELAMKENTDSSQLKSSLDAIKRKVVDASGSTSASSNVTSGLSLDLNGLLNADFTAGFDLNSFLGNTKNTNTTSITNQRGEQLYKSATARCKTAVLNSCIEQGIDANVVANAYDLEIDKQCIVYERALNDANKEMKNNVFNATNILQQARLLLAQNKNSYDLRGCVAAIDSCMQDEYVCGSDYELCLDPTGKYIAEGEVIKGSTPGISGGQSKNQEDLTADNVDSWNSNGMYDLYATWNYTKSSETKNAWSKGAGERLGDYIDAAVEEWKNVYSNNALSADKVAVYLLQKIGYIDSSDRVHGMCASVMKQCQDYAFETAKNKTAKVYKLDNEVVRQYLNGTLAKIKAQQDAILATYAEGCSGDVQSCLASNGYDTSNTTSTASQTAINACVPEITTCMSVSGYTPKDGRKLTLRAMRDWVASFLASCPVNTYLVDNGTSVSCQVCPKIGDIQTVSVGGQVTRCSCPEDAEDILAGELVDGLPTGKQVLAGCLKVEASGDQTAVCKSEYRSTDTTCVLCPKVDVYKRTSNRPALDYQVQMVGGTNSCECPAGFYLGYRDSNGGVQEAGTLVAPDDPVCLKP